MAITHHTTTKWMLNWFDLGYFVYLWMVVDDSLTVLVCFRSLWVWQQHSVQLHGGCLCWLVLELGAVVYPWMMVDDLLTVLVCFRSFCLWQPPNVQGGCGGSGGQKRWQSKAVSLFRWFSLFVCWSACLSHMHAHTPTHSCTCTCARTYTCAHARVRAHMHTYVYANDQGILIFFLTLFTMLFDSFSHCSTGKHL